MKKMIFSLIPILLFAYSLKVESQTVTQDSGFPPTEKDKYQTQIDSLKCDLDKLRKEAYEKAIEGANRSLTISMMVLGFVALMVAILGVWGFLKARKIEKEVSEELLKVEKSTTAMEERIRYECEKAEEERRKIVKLREDAEDETAGVRAIRREVVEISKDIKQVQQEIVKISQAMKERYSEIEGMKKSVDESERRVSAMRYFSEALKMDQEGKKEEATEKYAKAVELQPNFFEAYVNWSSVLLDLGKLKAQVKYFEHAIEKSKKATEIDPGNVLALNNCGIALREIGRLRNDPKYCDEAIEKYKKATEIWPKFVDSYSNWSVALYEIGKLRKDKKYFTEGLAKSKEAIAINENFAPGWYNEACGHALLKQKDQAIQFLAKAIQLDPKHKWMAKTDEDFKDLWDDEGFKKLVE